MDLLIAFIIFTASMLWCLLTDVTMVAALLVGYVCFVAVALRRGNKPADLLRFTKRHQRLPYRCPDSLYHSILTASWRAGGTIMFFVYYGIKNHPEPVPLDHFPAHLPPFLCHRNLLRCCRYFGVIFMALCPLGSVNEIVAAGVIMSGIYFGELLLSLFEHDPHCGGNIY